MTFVYIVRCNFTAPDREQAWNDWYSGPKIQQMLDKPHFLTCQRFRRTSGLGRGYLALWTMRSPEALRSPEYLSQWGFSEWTPLITDWSRDLFDAADRPERAFGVPLDGALQVVAFDGLDAASAAQARAASVPDDGAIWMPVVGLNKHTPLIALKVLRSAGAAAMPAIAGCSESALYQPLCELQVAPALGATA
jgi:hypothetical protein